MNEDHNEFVIVNWKQTSVLSKQTSLFSCVDAEETTAATVIITFKNALH